MENDIRHEREQGSALVISVLLLLIVSGLAMSTLQTTAFDQMVAGFQNQEQIAFYAAEAGIAEARAIVREMGGRAELPKYPAQFPDQANPTEISTAADYANVGRPKFYADPDLTDPIAYLGEGGACTEGCNMTIGGLKYNHTRWKINVVGESPSGDEKRVEVVATRLLAVGY